MLKSALICRDDRPTGLDGSRRGRDPETKNPGDTAGVLELTTDLLAGFFTWPQAGRLKSPRQAKARLSWHQGQAMPDGFCFIFGGGDVSSAPARLWRPRKSR